LRKLALPKIEERTLYEPLISYLKKIGFDAIGETRVTTSHPDILFKVDDVSFVIEVKIGKPETGLKAVAQASDYARKLGTQNTVILIYPEKYRNQVVFDSGIVQKVALFEDTHALVLTEYWTESLKEKPENIFQRLKTAILSKKVSVDFKTVVNLIENYVRDLNSIIYQIKTEELVSEVVDKLDLFSSIGEIKEKDVAKKQVVNLASYLLFNQLLFYHIFKKKSENSNIPELQEIDRVKSLQEYFDAITDIDYQSIYRVNILGHIPEKPVVLNTLNEVIKAIKLLRAEHITHDLAGRFFHDLIPFDVRKVLAAFYTHPVAAEILAGLTIDSWNETILDPACGSGTLLVSAYKRKMNLYEKLHGFKDLDAIHKRFLENDITGIDIMPFAAHITTLNLATQNIEQETNNVRIATKDSLSLSGVLKTQKFQKEGAKISSYTREIQQTLVHLAGAKAVRKEGAVSLKGKGEEFYLKPVDVVIMNPPFTDRDKMPKYMRDALNEYVSLVDLCGNAINLWGYFLALAHLLLKNGGKIGAVIPINIARGKTTEKIRNFLFDNYHVIFWIKPVEDFAFSEGASFKDSLFIAEKVKPKKEDLTGIILFKKSIRKMSLTESQKVIEKIKSLEVKEDRQYDNEYFSIRFVKQAELRSSISNLMLFIGGTSFENMDNIRGFINAFSEFGKDKLSNLQFNMMKEGITSPKGLGQIVYLTRPLDEPRVKRAFLVLEKDMKEEFMAKIKDANTSVKIPRKVTQPALRTSTGIRKIDVNKDHDYIVRKEFPEFAKVLTLSKWKGRFIWEMINKKIEQLGESRLVIPDKIRLSSENTHVLGIYSEEPLILSNLFFTYRDLAEEKCKILCLSLNSIITLSQFMSLKAETLGGYIRLSANDWSLTTQLDYDKLDNRERNVLLELFNELRDVEFPSIIEQLQNRFWARVKMDKTILQILGFSNSEIEKCLYRVYDSLVNELKATKGMEA
jgi:hypothetical protein